MAQPATAPHLSVMLNEVLAALAPAEGDVIVDGTFGAGGYSRAVLAANANARVVGIDRDISIKPYADVLTAEYGERFALVVGCYDDMESAARGLGLNEVQGVMLDIGVSSMQIDQPERGFSFSKDGPLDMRMGGDGQSAAEWVASVSEQELADVIYTYGEERFSRRIAKAIVAARLVAPILTTHHLASIVASVIRKKPDGIHPATRTFQAIRIYVNDELGQLERGLEAAERLLAPGGRLVVVSFHSLEDRIVKRFLADKSGKVAGVSRHVPVALGAEMKPSFKVFRGMPQRPSEQEIQQNPRARSAILRAAVKV